MELLFTKELALTNMSERQRAYRANYRQRVAGWYNGFLHIANIYTIGLTAPYPAQNIARTTLKVGGVPNYVGGM